MWFESVKRRIDLRDKKSRVIKVKTIQGFAINLKSGIVPVFKQIKLLINKSKRLY